MAEEDKYHVGYNQPPQYSPTAGNVQAYAADPSQVQPVITAQPNVMVMTTVGQTGTPAVVNVNPGVREWSSGKCDCFNDISSCLCGTFCGLCLTCRLSRRLGENTCVTCCVPGALITLRLKLRLLLGIRGSMCGDCMDIWCCGPCVACQMSREMDQNGIPFDTSCC